MFTKFTKLVLWKQKFQQKRSTIILRCSLINIAEGKMTLKIQISGLLIIETVMTERCPDMNMVNLGVLKNKGLMMTSIRKSTRMILEGIKDNKMTSFLMSA